MNPRPSTPERFWAKVDRTDTCWLWTAAKHPDGYGKFRAEGRALVYAHRWAYETLVGPIPEGLTLDHLCRVRSCVNPAHLEPCGSVENVMRGDSPPARAARTTHCPADHPYDDANTYIDPQGGRKCRACVRSRNVELVTCDPCGVTMYRTNIYAHRRTAKHQAAA